MANRIICLGDSGSSGGRVISATAGIIHNQRPVVRKGDLFACAVHGGRHRILGGDARIAANDRQLARHGDPIACGCTVRSIDPNAGVVLVAKGRDKNTTVSFCSIKFAGQIVGYQNGTRCGYNQPAVIIASPINLPRAIKFQKDCTIHPAPWRDEEQFLADYWMVCAVLCCCDESPNRGTKPTPSGRTRQLRGECFADVFKRVEELMLGGSRFKPEVTYDMTTPGGPTPQQGRPTLPQGDARRPDLVIARNPYAELLPNNIVVIFEITFKTDNPDEEQIRSYQKISPNSGIVYELDEKKCNCDIVREYERGLMWQGMLSWLTMLIPFLRGVRIPRPPPIPPPVPVPG